MKPQCIAVLAYMKHRGSITPNAAQQALGVGRLAARVRDLRDEGYEIKSERISVQTRNGEARVARYSLA